MIAFTPTLRTLIPLLPSGMEMEGDEMFKLVSKDVDFAVEKETIPAAAPQQFVPDMIFEQEPSQLLNAILPLYINGQLLRTQQESVASELASRMSAMQSATDNAKDLQGRLESEMTARARRRSPRSSWRSLPALTRPTRVECVAWVNCAHAGTHPARQLRVLFWAPLGAVSPAHPHRAGAGKPPAKNANDALIQFSLRTDPVPAIHKVAHGQRCS